MHGVAGTPVRVCKANASLRAMATGMLRWGPACPRAEGIGGRTWGSMTPQSALHGMDAECARHGMAAEHDEGWLRRRQCSVRFSASASGAWSDLRRHTASWHPAT